MEQKNKRITIELLPYHEGNRVHLAISAAGSGSIYAKTFDTLTQACKELSEQDVIAKIADEMYYQAKDDKGYSIESTPYKDGSIHYTPDRRNHPFTASVYAINSLPMTNEIACKRWITKTMKQENSK